MIISCIDIETTGLDKATDRIVQLSIQNFDSSTFELKESANWYIVPSGSWNMDPEAQSVHGITPEYLYKYGVSLKDIYDQWCYLISHHNIMTYNGSKFDIPMIEKDFRREDLKTEFDKCKFIDVLDIERKLNNEKSNKLGIVYERYMGKEFEGAHDSSLDILATIEIFHKQIESIKGKPNRSKIVAASMLESTTNSSKAPDGFIYYDNSYWKIRFGKYKNWPLIEVFKKDPGYIKWMINSGATSPTTKETTRQEIMKYSSK